MICIWNLLQSERARVKLRLSKTQYAETTIHKVADDLANPVLDNLCTSKRALVRAMTMPAPVMELIACYIPLPRSYETRLRLLARRAQVNPDSAVFCAMDFIDEVLEEGRLLEAFDEANVPPPSNFSSWVSKAYFLQR